MTRRTALVVLTAALALSACTGVPSSSAPQVVTSVNAAQPSGPVVESPTVGADARTVVRQFLTASIPAETQHQVAQTFLTREAFTRWSGATATVVDALQVGNFVNGNVTVSGLKVGTIDTAGIYTPNLQGDGGGGAPASFVFGMKQVPGQGWRIDALQNGVVLDTTEFQRVFQPRTVFFMDSVEKHLVADLRYSTLTDAAPLASWLVAQVAAGPRPELQAGTSIELPSAAQADPAKVTVTMGSTTQVSVPGAGQLDPASLSRLAAQLSYTLLPATSGEVQIVDAGHPISLSGVGSTFIASQFSDVVQPANDTPSLYYIVDGRVVDVDGTPIAASASSGYSLTSVAIARNALPDLRIAGTTGSRSNGRLVIGTVASGLHTTSLRGALSRPSWAPNLDEVWIGAGSTLYRVGLHGRPIAVPVSGSNGAIAGQVLAVRFSPEGTRIALVVNTEEGSQVWVGSVSRGRAQTGQVRVDGLEPISPQGVAVTDVAWNDQLKLFAIGKVKDAGVSSVFEVQVDGSLWTSRGTSNLPQAPDSITVAENEVAWVSAGSTVWEQQAGSWTSPGSGETRGTNPVYLE